MGPRARDRRRQECDEFVSAAGTGLLRAAFLLTGERTAAEDLVQTALLRTFVHWPQARQAPRAYANQVLLNLARDRWRQQSRWRTHPVGDIESEVESLPVDSSGHASGPISDVIERTTMLRALDSLPDRQREVIVLRFYMDMTVEETAAILDIPEGTVKSTLSRAVDRLRPMFDPDATDAAKEVPHAD